MEAEMKPRIRVKMRKGRMIRAGGVMETIFGRSEALNAALRSFVRSNEWVWKVEKIAHDGDYIKYWVVYGG